MTFKFLFDSTSTKRKPILFKEYRLTQEFNMKAKKYYFKLDNKCIFNKTFTITNTTC